MANEYRRFVYRPEDINVVKEKGVLNAHEVLLDYNNNDIVLIQEDLKEWSLIDFIKNSLADKLSSEHLKLSNAHRIVSDKNNGFMSTAQFKTLNESKELLEEIKNKIMITEDLSDIEIINKEFELNENDITVNLSVKLGSFIYRINKTISVLDRPDIDFVGMSGKTGIRYDLIDIVVNDDKLLDIEYKADIKILENCVYDNDEIYEYRKGYLYNEEKRIYPLYTIEVRNNNRFSIENKNGYIKENLELNDIYDFKIGYDFTKTRYITSLKDSNYTKNSVIAYVPFNGDSIEKKSKIDLNKNISFKNSPYGYMMRSCINEGNMIDIIKQRNFSCEFLITNEYVDEELVSFYNVQIEKVLSIYIEDDKLYIKDMNGNVAKSNIIKDSFIFINIKFMSTLQFVQISQNGGNEMQLNTNIDITSIRKFQINGINTPIGQFIIYNNTTYSNNLVNNNLNLFNKSELYNEKIITYREKIFNLYDSNEYFNVSVNKFNPDKLSKGDYLIFNFNKNLAIYSDDEVKIIDHSGNKLVLEDGHNLEEGDIVTIKKYREYYNTMILFVDGNDVYINNIPNFSLFNATIYNIDKNSAYFNLYYEDNVLPNVERISKSVYKVYIDRDIPLDAVFKIRFNEILNEKFKIGEITSVLFDNELALSNILEKTFDKSEITIKYNGVQVSNDFLKNEKVIFINDTVELECEIFLNDFIDFSKIDPLLFNDLIHVSAEIEMSSGSNDLYINDKLYKRGNVISSYKINNEVDKLIDPNGVVNIKIRTGKGSKKGKLLLGNFKIRLYSVNKENNLFYLKNENDKIIDFVMRHNDVIYINTDKECLIETRKEFE